jgi:hypothetical protein
MVLILSQQFEIELASKLGKFSFFREIMGCYADCTTNNEAMS